MYNNGVSGAGAKMGDIDEQELMDLGDDDEEDWNAR